MRLLHMPWLSAQTTLHWWLPRAEGRHMSGTEWVALEQKVSELMELCAVLSRENRALRAQQQNWTVERAKLIEKNELAKSRVESMITRLKALEQD
jgi:cell division protein ZapB